MMRRIIVIGCPGSGKSRFSVSLHEKTGIPLYHLDMLYWNADKTTVDKDVFLARLDEVMSKDEWIIDGNYMSTMEARVSVCDTVFFLDFPSEVCLLGVGERRGKPRRDMPWIETEEDSEFIKYILDFKEIQVPEIENILGKYKDKKVIVFKSREEVDAFLKDHYGK